MTSRKNFSITVVDFLVELIIEKVKGTIGTSNFITPYALKIGSTFEDARSLVYEAIDRGEIEMTPNFHLRLSQKTLMEISEENDEIILAFFRKSIENKGLQRIYLNEAVNTYRNALNVPFEYANQQSEKLKESGKIGSTFEQCLVILDGEIPAAQIRNEELVEKVSQLTKSFKHGNYIEASNRIYDILKQRIPLARTVILKKFGKHDETSAKATWKKSKADISGILKYKNSWLSDLDACSKKRIVQHNGVNAIAWNLDGTRSFDIDIRMLVMSEGEFIREVRRMCDERKEFNRYFIASDIQSHINIAEDRLAYLRKIERDFKNGRPTKKYK